jgi:hypothetical protein
VLEPAAVPVPVASAVVSEDVEPPVPVDSGPAELLVGSELAEVEEESPSPACCSAQKALSS